MDKTIIDLLQEVADASCENCRWTLIYGNAPKKLEKEFDRLLEEKCSRCKIKNILGS